MWKNTVERGRPQVTVWRMCTACWINTATDTNAEYVMCFCFSTVTMVTRKPEIVLYT